jgi:hypothetical protein
MSATLTSDELTKVRAMAAGSARNFYMFARYGQLKQVVLTALFKVTLKCSNNEAFELMHQTMTESDAAANADSDAADPVLLAIVKMVHVRCLEGRPLTNDEREQLRDECLRAVADAKIAAQAEDA